VDFGPNCELTSAENLIWEKIQQSVPPINYQLICIENNRNGNKLPELLFLFARCHPLHIVRWSSSTTPTTVWNKTKCI